MKVIKRNGAEVDFTPQKIVAAIAKANAAGLQKELGEAQIESIADNITRDCQKLNRAVSVEEIQDMVEKQLMVFGAYETARRYIKYRYERTLARHANTTDARILSLIDCVNEDAKQENANKNPVVNSTQRDYMAGEVSKDVSRRILLPPDVVKAHDEGIIHFHKLNCGA